MTRRLLPAAALLAALALPALAAEEQNACAACHEKIQPGIVSDWRLSRHAGALVGCEACHGALHQTSEDAALAAHPTVDTCQKCHELQATQFRSGKHARAWTAVKVLPTFHHLAQGSIDDPSGCATCHRIGIRTEAETAALKKAGASHGLASCDACHTRHLFSPQEARQPEACQACHGTLQYDAWASSKHGTRHLLKRAGQLPAEAAAPTCQVCHMQNGNHANRTPWGNLGLRLPLPQDPGWAADRKVLLVALGLINAAEGEGPRGDGLFDSGLLHLDRIDYQNERHKLTQSCRQCHGIAFVREELDRRDEMLRKADALCAAAVREVVALYDDGVLEKRGAGPFPDLVKAPLASPIEQRLATLFFDHRAKLMATAFHMSPDAAGWMDTLTRDVAAIRAQADELRAPTPAPRKGTPRRKVPTPANPGPAPER